MMYESIGENSRWEMSVSPIRPYITVTHLHLDERARERKWSLTEKYMKTESVMSL